LVSAGLASSFGAATSADFSAEAAALRTSLVSLPALLSAAAAAGVSALTSAGSSLIATSYFS